MASAQNLAKAFIQLPGGGAAIYDSSGLDYYRHADWQGSSRLTSTQGRAVYSISAYAPFGEQYAVTNASDPSFTGQDSDTVSGLYDFLYRENSSSQGRWISPDPAGLAAVDLSNPQSWNRYAYVANNPLSETDPLGLCPGCKYDPPPNGTGLPYFKGQCVQDHVPVECPDLHLTGLVNEFDVLELEGKPTSKTLVGYDDGPIYSYQYGNIGVASIGSADPTSPQQPVQQSAARMRCEQGLRVKMALAGLANAKVSVVNTGDYLLDQLHEVFSSKSFQAGAGASVATTLTGAGVADAAATTAGAAMSEIIVPLAAAGLTGYSLYQGYLGARDYWKEHQNDCANIP